MTRRDLWEVAVIVAGSIGVVWLVLWVAIHW